MKAVRLRPCSSSITHQTAPPGSSTKRSGSPRDYAASAFLSNGLLLAYGTVQVRVTVRERNSASQSKLACRTIRRRQDLRVKLDGLARLELPPHGELERGQGGQG